jgi:hypothetical protein
MLRFYGPGMIVEVATSAEPVAQAMINVNDEPIAWPVLSRLCQAMKWRLMDVESGRVMNW